MFEDKYIPGRRGVLSDKVSHRHRIAVDDRTPIAPVLAPFETRNAILFALSNGTPKRLQQATTSVCERQFGQAPQGVTYRNSLAKVLFCGEAVEYSPRGKHHRVAGVSAGPGEDS